MAEGDQADIFTAAVFYVVCSHSSNCSCFQRVQPHYLSSVHSGSRLAIDTTFSQQVINSESRSQDSANKY